MLLVGIETLIFAVATSYYFRIPLGAGFMAYACAVIIFLYGADFLGLLQDASIALHVIGVLLFMDWVRRANSAIRRLRFPRNIYQDLAIAAVVAFAFTQVALLCSTRQFFAWDEFSHWGTIIRSIYEANTFHFSPNPLYFQDYPPGLALFSYHVLQIMGYSESNAYFSYALLLGCFSASLLHLAARGTLLGFLASILAVWASVEMLGPGWASVLVDHVLAFFFAGILAAYYLIRDAGGRLMILPFFLAAFTLTKQAASSLALLASVIIIIDWTFSQLGRRDGLRWNTLGFWLPAAGLSVSLIGTVLLTVASWRAYVVTAGLQQGWGSYSPYSHLTELANCCQSPREVAVIAKFASAFFNTPTSMEAPGPIWQFGWEAVRRIVWTDLFSGELSGAPGKAMAVLFLASLFLVPLSSSSLDRWRNASFAFLMTLGGLGYALSLLITYLYAFSEYEGRTLASFDRFFSVYLLSWLMTLLAVAFRTFNHFRPSGRLAGHAVTAFLICGIFWSQISEAKPILTRAQYEMSYQDSQLTHTLAMREPIQRWVAGFRADLPSTARVFISWPKTSGLEFWLTKHELLPLVTNLTCFAFTPKRQPELIQECTMSSERLQEMLKEYDFVAVGDHLDEIQRDYPGIFAALPVGMHRGLFRVERLPSFKLVPYYP